MGDVSVGAAVRRLLLSGTAVLLLASGCGGAGSTSPFPTSTPTDRQPTPGTQTVPVEAELQAIRFAWVESGTPLVAEGKPGIKVTYIASIGTCGLLDRVEVEETDATVTVKVYVGNLVLPPDNATSCLDVAHRYFTLVPLKKELGDRQVINGVDGNPARDYFTKPEVTQSPQR